MPLRLLATNDGPAGEQITIVTTQGNLGVGLVDGSAGGGASAVIWNPGAPTAPPSYQTLAEVEALVTAADGALTVFVDSSVAPAIIPPGNVLDGKGLLTLSPARGPVGGVPMTLTIADGGQLKNPLAINGQMDVVSNTTTIPALVVDNSNQGINISEGARLRLLAGATRAFLDVVAGAGNLVGINIEFNSLYRSEQAGVPFVNLTQAGALFSNFFTRLGPSSQPQSGAVGGVVGSTYVFVYDASVTVPDNGAFNGTVVSFETDQGLVTASSIDFPLATMQARGGTGFVSIYPVYAVALASARWVGGDINTIEQFAAPALATATGQIIDGVTLRGFTGIADLIATGGFNAPPPQFLQTDASSSHIPNLQVAVTGDTLNNLTAGHIASTILVAIQPRQTA